MPLHIATLFELGPDDAGSIGGGVELHAYNLSKELARRGHKITYITGAIPDNEEKKQLEGIDIQRLDFCSLIRRAYDPQQLKFLRQLFFLTKTAIKSINSKEWEDFDIFHGHIYSSGLAAYLLGKKRSVRIINTIHGSYYKHWKHLTKNRFVAGLYRSMERRLAPLLTKICHYQIHTDYEFANLVRSWSKPKFHDKILTVLNGVDTKKFNSNVKPNEKLIDEKGPIIMTTRRLVVKNGVLFLIKAFKKIIEEFPTSKLIIIGDGPEKLTIQREVQNLNLESNIELIGMLPNSIIPSYLSAADVVVVPSIVEASSISVLEAMAMRKPVVASDIPGIREISNYGKNCVLVPSMNPAEIANGTLEILQSNEKAEEIAKNGNEEILQHYSWEKKAEEIEQIYLRALEK